MQLYVVNLNGERSETTQASELFCDLHRTMIYFKICEETMLKYPHNYMVNF